MIFFSALFISESKRWPVIVCVASGERVRLPRASSCFPFETIFFFNPFNFTPGFKPSPWKAQRNYPRNRFIPSRVFLFASEKLSIASPQILWKNWKGGMEKKRRNAYVWSLILGFFYFFYFVSRRLDLFTRVDRWTSKFRRKFVHNKGLPSRVSSLLTGRNNNQKTQKTRNNGRFGTRWFRCVHVLAQESL